MKPLSVILVAGMLCAGCATTPGHAPALLGQADAKPAAQDYRGAVALYAEFLETNLQDPQAARARATQGALGRLLSLQTELERVTLRNYPTIKNTVIIMTSAKAYKPDIGRARELGATDYVVKPDRTDELMALIERPRASSQPRAAQ